MDSLINISVGYQTLIAIGAILIIPKLLIRVHVPSGISALILGCLCTNFLGWFQESELILTFARLGITSLFLYAGMEIELSDLKKELIPLTKYIIKSLLIILSTAVGIYYFTSISFQISLIISIAIFTPSAGFILSSLKFYDLTDKEIFWIKLKAISKEIAAVITLFVALQLDDVSGLIRSKLIFIAVIFCLPPLFKFFLPLNNSNPSKRFSAPNWVLLSSLIKRVVETGCSR